MWSPDQSKIKKKETGQVTWKNTEMFHQREYIDGKWEHEKMLCPTWLAIKETQTKTAMCYQYMLIRTANLKVVPTLNFGRKLYKTYAL